MGEAEPEYYEPLQAWEGLLNTQIENAWLYFIAVISNLEAPILLFDYPKIIQSVQGLFHFMALKESCYISCERRYGLIGKRFFKIIGQLFCFLCIKVIDGFLI